MPRFAQVVAKSNLIQLDREFDFVIPEHLDAQISIGQQVSFPFGRSKNLQHGFVVGISETSDYATSELSQVVSPEPVLSMELLSFCRQVADRQCVSIGEILAAAIPDHMVRVTKEEPISLPKPAAIPVPFELSSPLGKRSAVLSAARTLSIHGSEIADWVLLLLAQASLQLEKGRSAILIVPEQDDIYQLVEAAKSHGLEQYLIIYAPNQKRSDRFKAFHKTLAQELCIVVGTRSACYAPVSNLGLIGLYDDLDDSLRDQGSPFTHARELALMRAQGETEVLFVAPYRSVEVQRLVDINYLSDHDIKLPPARIAFTSEGTRFDDAAYKLIKERLDEGPVLVLLPRKGSSAALYCNGCGERLRCSCGGMIWEPSSSRAVCRICSKPHLKCPACATSTVKRGRTGSTRTVAELGRVFPQVAIAEATFEKRPSGLKPKRQLVVATPSAAPRVKGGYAGILILDSDIWLSRQSLNAEQIAIRDWQTAIELLSNDGRVVLSGVDRDLGQAFSMQQHRQLAIKQLAELRSLGLPPVNRICTVETDPENTQAVLDIASDSKAKVLRVDADSGTVLLSFSYQTGPDLAKSLRALALRTSARQYGAGKRRGVRVVMDDPQAL